MSPRLVSFGRMARVRIWLDLPAAALPVPVLWWWSFPMLGVDASLLGGGR